MSRKPNPDTEAFVTLATNDPYAYGALVLGQSLRNVATTRKLAVLVTSQVTQPLRQQLTMVYDHVQQVDPLDSQDEAHLALLTRPELGITFSKIHCWTLTRYSKCVFLDADCLVLRNVDELFDREELSAAPDIGWPDCFNSGVFVFRPSEETHQAILRCALTHGSFDGGDQGLLNTFFKDWSSKDISRHLPFIYNMTSSTGYSYLPAYFNFGHEIRIVHFIGPGKPWRYRYNLQNGQLQPPEGMNGSHDTDFIKKWWSIFTTHIKPRLERESGCQLSELNLEGVNSFGSQSPRARQHAWERGEIDYLGRDGFDFILDQICSVFERDDVPGDETPPSNGALDGQDDGKRTEDGGGKELEKEPPEDTSPPDEEKKQGKANGASPTEDEDPSSSNDNKGQNGNQMEIESPSDDKTSSKCPCVLL